MKKNMFCAAVVVLAILASAPSAPAAAAVRDDGAAALASLVSPAEKDFLLAELARIQPPARIRDLAGYGARQSELGGGFYGMMPDQLADPDSIPVPADEAGLLAAALCLARQRQENAAALAQLNSDYATSFRGESLARFLAEEGSAGEVPATLGLELDVSALEGFFAARADGEITAAEAAALAELPSNQAMLRHRRDLGYVPEPLPDTGSLAQMIAMAGSTDPLDRLWCWINSQNAFDYADLFQHAEGYGVLLAELEAEGDALVEAVLGRVAAHAPEGIRLETTFAMTVGWAIRGWATPEMAGLNVEQVKDDWPFLMGTMTEETYHRLQLEIFPSPDGQPAREFADLVAADTGDPRHDRLFEIVAYTVAEGAANLVRGPYADPGLSAKAPAGAALMDRFVRQVVVEGDLENADALINEGLQGNGPLYGLGWKLASLIAEHDGTRAVGEYQQRGPVAFFLRGADLAAENGDPLLTPEVVLAVRELGARR